MYFHKTPDLLKSFYSDLVWSIPSNEKTIYLTFDDGPVPEATPFVLDVMKDFGAKATFFCIGDNVRKHPEIFERIIRDGHCVGNHSMNHLNGWNHGDFGYLKNVLEAARFIPENLFRPPYGKITRSQAVALRQRYSIIMWDVLSGDFDVRISGEKCLENVTKNVVSGSIVVFHDSIKAYPRMSYALPRSLEYLQSFGYTFESIPNPFRH